MFSFKKKYSEEALIAGCAVNDRRHQEALYMAYFDKMYGMCLKYIRDEEKAMDVLHQGFLKVYKNISNYESKGSFEGWIRRIVYNTMVDFMRQESRLIRFLDIGDYEVKNNNASDQQLLYDDLIIEINKLPPASCQVFKYYCIEGYNHAEIAELMGISEGTSKWHLSNARKILQEKILNRKKNERELFQSR